MTDFSVKGLSSSSPNPRVLDLDFPEYQALLEEQQELYGQYREASFKVRELEDQIQVMERRAEADYAASFRGDVAEPDEAAIEAARAELARERKKLEALHKVLEGIEADKARVLAANRTPWIEAVDDALRVQAGDVEERLQDLRASIARVYALSALKEHIERPRRHWGHMMEPKHLATSYGGNIRPGELFSLLLQEIRSVAATSETERLQSMYAGMTTQLAEENVWTPDVRG